MSIYSVTAADVVAVDGVQFDWVNAAVAINAGQTVYRKLKAGSTTEYELFLGVNDTEEHTRIHGIALTSADPGQPVKVAKNGAVKLGSIFTTSGSIVVVSSTAGSIEDYADLAQPDYLFIVGVSRQNGETIDLIMRYAGQYGIQG